MLRVVFWKIWDVRWEVHLFFFIFFLSSVLTSSSPVKTVTVCSSPLRWTPCFIKWPHPLTRAAQPASSCRFSSVRTVAASCCFHPTWRSFSPDPPTLPHLRSRCLHPHSWVRNILYGQKHLRLHLHPFVDWEPWVARRLWSLLFRNQPVELGTKWGPQSKILGV